MKHLLPVDVDATDQRIARAGGPSSSPRSNSSTHLFRSLWSGHQIDRGEGVLAMVTNGLPKEGNEGQQQRQPHRVVELALHLGDPEAGDAVLVVELSDGQNFDVYLPEYLAKVMKAHVEKMIRTAGRRDALRGWLSAKRLALELNGGKPMDDLDQAINYVSHRRMEIRRRIEKLARLDRVEVFHWVHGKGTRLVTQKVSIQCSTNHE